MKTRMLNDRKTAGRNAILLLCLVVVAFFAYFILDKTLLEQGRTEWPSMAVSLMMTGLFVTGSLLGMVLEVLVLGNAVLVGAAFLCDLLIAYYVIVAVNRSDVLFGSIILSNIICALFVLACSMLESGARKLVARLRDSKTR